MPDIRFHRTDLERTCTFAENLAQRVQFDWITDGRAGAMGLNIIDRTRFDTRRRKRIRDHLNLAGHARREKAALSVAVVVDRGSLDHRVNGVARGQRVGKSPEDDNTEATAKNSARRGRVEGPAMTIAGEDFILAIAITNGMRELDADRPGDSHVAALV
jgi:hypothetical protein